MFDHEERLRTSLGYRNALLHRLSTSLLSVRLQELDICPGLIPYIMSTMEHGSMTQDELSTFIRVDPAATTRALKSLEKKGLVKREVNPKNRRQKLVSPTDKTREIYGKLVPILQRHNEVMLDGFTDDEKATVLKAMDRVLANVQNKLDEVRDA